LRPGLPRLSGVRGYRELHGFRVRGVGLDLRHGPGPGSQGDHRRLLRQATGVLLLHGCSGGGHEALVEAQRYPHDFNGILVGAPGNIEAQLLGVVPAWVIAVNTGADGREILTSEKLPALHAAVIKACGNAQGLIEDPRSSDAGGRKPGEQETGAGARVGGGG
jgi:Tannase and feruloyl esterase